MKRTASVLCFLVALILLGTALTDWLNEVHDAPARIQRDIADINTGSDFSEIDRRIAEHREADRWMAFEALAGTAFLIGGFALWRPIRN